MRSLHYLIPAFFFTTACQTGTFTKKQASDTDSLSYRYETFRLESKHIVENEGKRDTTYFQAQYPDFDQAEIDTLISKNLSASNNPDTSYQSLQEEGQAFINNFDDFIQMDEYPRAWYFDVKTIVLVQTPQYLATKVDWNEYSGGAHGNYGTIYYNYDLESLDTLGLEDIVDDAHQKELAALGEKVFRQQEKLNPEDELDNYFFENNTFNLNNNFTLTREGLLFLYNIYEIKPYASGTTEILLPGKDIMPWLTEKGKTILAQLQKNAKRN